jgi:microcystin-dependent protein
MTQIHADVRDSRGTPLAGFIRVTADYQILDDTTSFLPVPADIPLVSGEATFELEPSEVAGVSYLFEFYRVDLIETLVWSFRSRVPDSETPIQLVTLQAQTGVTSENRNTTVAAILRSLYVDDNFWDRAREVLIPFKGPWEPLDYYKRGDYVVYQGSSWIYRSPLALQGVVPGSDPDIWSLAASKGDPGSGVTGSLDPYDANLWNGSDQAVSQDAIRDIIEALPSTLGLSGFIGADGATLTDARIGDTYLSTENSNSIAYTSWVQAIANEIRKALCPIGMIAAFPYSSAPTGWVAYDGRVLSRTTYAALFGVLGTTWNTGGESGSEFRVPDFRGRTMVMMDSTTLQGPSGRVPGLNLATARGTEKVTLAANNIPPLPVTRSGQVGGATTGFYADNFLQNANISTIYIGNQAGAVAVENMQPSLGVLIAGYAGV